MLFDTNAMCKFQWNNGGNIVMLQGLRHSDIKGTMRLATIRIQKARICLVAAEGTGLVYIPYVWENEAWKRVPARDVVIEPVPAEAFDSENALHASMERQMLLQFRNLMSGYYDDYPTQHVILNALKADPYKHTLEDNLYTFYPANVAEDEEFDGAFEVYCQGGYLIIPYVGDRDKDDVKLLLKYVNYIPGKDAETVLERVGQRMDNVRSIFSNLHWHNIRHAIERMWSKNEQAL